MKIVKMIKSSAVALSLTLPAAAFADTAYSYVYDTNPTVLKVLSNGQDYTKVDLLGNFSIAAKLKYNTGTAGRIKSWQAYPTITNGYGIASQIPNTQFYKQSQSYSIGNRPKKIDKTLGFAIPATAVQSAAVSMCNWKADWLRGQGKSDKWIFDRHHEVHFEVELVASVDASGAGAGSVSWEYHEPHHFTVRCMKWRGAQIDTVGGITDRPNPTHGKPNNLVTETRKPLVLKAKRRAN